MSTVRTAFGIRNKAVAAATLTPETRGMIAEPEFAAMKPTAVVINVGRGPVIREEAQIYKGSAQNTEKTFLLRP